MNDKAWVVAGIFVIGCLFAMLSSSGGSNELPKSSSSSETAHSDAPPEITDSMGHKAGSIGYEGTLMTGTKIPVFERADDVILAVHQDKGAMRDLFAQDLLFSADGGAKVRILAHQWPGLTKIAVLSGESHGREGWVTDEVVE